MNLPVGLLINFGAPKLKEGLKRIANSRASLRLCVNLLFPVSPRTATLSGG
jgi:hypothetical protein